MLFIYAKSLTALDTTSSKSKIANECKFFSRFKYVAFCDCDNVIAIIDCCKFVSGFSFRVSIYVATFANYALLRVTDADYV